MKTKLILLISALMLLVAGYAQDNQTQPEEEPLVVTLEAYIVTQVTLDDGKIEERFTPAKEAEPGDVIEYRIIGRNTTDAPLNQITLGNQIPTGSFYINNSASSSDIAEPEFSAPGYTSPSGAEYGPAPLTVTLTINGVEKEVVIAPEQYSALQWQLREPIAAESEVTFIYRVEVK